MDSLMLNEPDCIHRVLVTDARRYVKWGGLEVARCLLGNGLLTSEGEAHRGQRRSLQSAFSAPRVSLLAPAMQDCIREALACWPSRGQISAGAEMGRITLRVIGEYLFGVRLSDQVISEVRTAVGEAVAVFREADEELSPELTARAAAVRARLEALVMQLGTLLGHPISDAEQLDQAITLLIAGHETTAHALTFALYLLSRHAEEQESVRTELRSNGLSDLEALPRLRAVLLETLRLYPPSWLIGRRTIEPTTLGDKHLAEGCTVLMSQYTMHRDAAYFEDPLCFKPARWCPSPTFTDTPPQGGTLPKGCYFPFGAGPRVCIGEHFAWLEMMLLLGTVLLDFDLGECPTPSPAVHFGLTLAPDEELWIPIARTTGR